MPNQRFICIHKKYNIIAIINLKPRQNRVCGNSRTNRRVARQCSYLKNGNNFKHKKYN